MEADSKPKLCARIDLTKVAMVKDVELGSTVDVVITGKVKSMRGPEEGLREGYSTNGKRTKEEKYVYPGTLEIEISEVKIKSIGEFDGLGDDD